MVYLSVGETKCFTIDQSFDCLQLINDKSLSI